MSSKVHKVFGLAGLLVLALLAVVQLPGCGGSSGGGAAATGRLQVGLTDKLSDEFQQVVVSIREVRVVPAGMENAADNDPGLPVVATFATPHTVDILTLRFQQDLLGTITLPAGNYSQVRLILDPNPAGQGSDPVNYLVLKSAPTVRIPLTTPSGQQSGLKVLGRFEVEPGIINAILLDFDPNTAIVPRSNGGYNLKPTGIRIVQSASPLTDFGSLSGTVVATFKDWSSATVSVVPQGGGQSRGSRNGLQQLLQRPLGGTVQRLRPRRELPGARAVARICPLFIAAEHGHRGKRYPARQRQPRAAPLIALPGCPKKEGLHPCRPSFCQAQSGLPAS